MNSRHWKECLSVCLIGDGIISLLFPSGHYRLWSAGPKWNCEWLAQLAEKPMLIRGIGLLELLIGLWLAKDQVADQ